MKQQFLLEKDKYQKKLKVTKQASFDSPKKKMVVASDDSDQESQVL